VVGLLQLRLRFALQGSAPSPVQQTGAALCARSCDHEDVQCALS
jgi:hypothetical protein